MMRVPGMVISLALSEARIWSKSLGDTGAMKSTPPDSSAATRVCSSLIGVNTMRSTLPLESIVPVVGEAFKNNLDALFTRDYLEWSGA